MCVKELRGYRLRPSVGKITNLFDYVQRKTEVSLDDFKLSGKSVGRLAGRQYGFSFTVHRDYLRWGSGSEYEPAYDPTAASEQLQADVQDIVASLVRHAPFFLTLSVVRTVVFSVLTIAGRGAMIRATAEVVANANAEPQRIDRFQKELGRFWVLFCAGVFMSFGFITLYRVPMLLF